jgi:hypothetical protein
LTVHYWFESINIKQNSLHRKAQFGSRTAAFIVGTELKATNEAWLEKAQMK